MAYTKSGQIPVGGKYTLGDYTFSLTTQDIPVTDFKYVYSEIVDGAGKRDGKGVNLQLNRPIESWYVEATETEASVYARCSNDTMPHHISVVKLPDKVVYNTGDAIDLTGIEVRAFNSDGTVWENDTYPGGYIPINELLSQFRTDQKYGFQLADSVLWREVEYTFDDGEGTIGDSAYTARSFIPYIEGSEASIGVRYHHYVKNYCDEHLTASFTFYVPIGYKLVFIKHKALDHRGKQYTQIKAYAFSFHYLDEVKYIALVDTWGYRNDANYGFKHYDINGSFHRNASWMPYYYRLPDGVSSIGFFAYGVSNSQFDESDMCSINDAYNLFSYDSIPLFEGDDIRNGPDVYVYENHLGPGEYSISESSIPIFDIDDVMNYVCSDGTKPSYIGVIHRIAQALFYTDDGNKRKSDYTAITLAWKRPIDGAVLTTSFGIANSDN